MKMGLHVDAAGKTPWVRVTSSDDPRKIDCKQQEKPVQISGIRLTHVIPARLVEGIGHPESCMA